MQRRKFIMKSIATVSGAGVVFLGSSFNKAHAGLFDAISKLVKPIFMAAANYYAGSWVKNTKEQMDELSEMFGKDEEENSEKKLGVIGTTTDAQNAKKNEIANARILLETAPHPSSGCNREAISATSGKLKEGLEKAKIASVIRMANIANGITNSDIIQIDKNITETFMGLSGEQVIKSVTSTSFLTSDGYINTEFADRYRTILVNSLFLGVSIPNSTPKTSSLLARRQADVVRASAINDALGTIYSRRIRSKSVSNAIKSVANKTELEIIKRIEKETGKIAEIDLARYEVERTYLNPEWHSEIMSLKAMTPLAKEMTELVAHSNKLDVDLLKLQELTNTIDGIAALVKIDDSLDNLRSMRAMI
jgi:hypothetical protein